MSSIPTTSSDSFEKVPSSDSFRRERRRLSQARHRENVAESYRQLRSLLPVKQTNKLYNVRYNKTVLLEKAREYVHHLEATLKTLIQEKNSQSSTSCIYFRPSYRKLHNNKHVYSRNQPVTLREIREDFARNFALHKPISSYEHRGTPVFKTADITATCEAEDDDVIDMIHNPHNRKRLLCNAETPHIRPNIYNNTKISNLPAPSNSWSSKRMCHVIMPSSMATSSSMTTKANISLAATPTSSRTIIISKLKPIKTTQPIANNLQTIVTSVTQNSTIALKSTVTSSASQLMKKEKIVFAGEEKHEECSEDLGFVSQSTYDECTSQGNKAQYSESKETVSQDLKTQGLLFSDYDPQLGGLSVKIEELQEERLSKAQNLRDHITSHYLDNQQFDSDLQSLDYFHVQESQTGVENSQCKDIELQCSKFQESESECFSSPGQTFPKALCLVSKDRQLNENELQENIFDGSKASEFEGFYSDPYFMDCKSQDFLSENSFCTQEKHFQDPKSPLEFKILDNIPEVDQISATKSIVNRSEIAHCSYDWWKVKI